MSAAAGHGHHDSDLAMSAPAPLPPDHDLASIAQARDLARRAKLAAAALAAFSQDRIDRCVDEIAAAALAHAEALAHLAVEETGYGIAADKVQKNRFAAQRVHAFIRPMKTVGVVARHPDRRIIEIAEPFGVVAAIVPSTNPTSTAIYKILIALKARCPIVLSPHPAAVKSISRVAEVMDEAARRAGAPAGAVNWMTAVTIEGTQELMKHRDVAVILATGGLGLVRAAYASGKPAYGVGPGNAPAFIERTAEVTKAVRDIVAGKTFDNGLLCSSENSVVVDEPVADRARQAFLQEGAYFLSQSEVDVLARALVTPSRLPNPTLVGKSATVIAQACGLVVPSGTRVLIAPLEGGGRDYPLSIEKLCPVLSWYVVRDWHEGCERCRQILRYGGMGHTMSIHSQNDSVILEFGLKKPAFRIIVNSPTSHGSIGLTTGLDPALTLGCGGYGGNMTSDNISPRHLLNVKRVAYETTSLAALAETARPVEPTPERGIAAATLSKRIAQFLEGRGFEPTAGEPPRRVRAAGSAEPDGPAAEADRSRPPEGLRFVCEEDVRAALAAGRTLYLAERAIVTPAARELGEHHRLFVDLS